MEAGGYTRPEFWLSLGWTTVNEQRWQAPLYWVQRDGAWWNFTLSGFRPVNESEPVTHVSYFEADAYANWDGARLPTEFEWERAASELPIEGNFVDDAALSSRARSAEREWRRRACSQMFGDVWEWTRSAYLPYPGYRAVPGALGEYNGKFMCNQMVLRGGSCATSRDHIRADLPEFLSAGKTLAIHRHPAGARPGMSGAPGRVTRARSRAGQRGFSRRSRRRTLQFAAFASLQIFLR